jgi:D-alanyl-D-alanine carboxypeptidase/D-alanyl-D-alanine-endopeptidase (penicillin-binding protein 4)
MIGKTLAAADDLSLGLVATDPGRTLNGLAGLEVLVRLEEVLNLEPLELRHVKDVAEVLAPDVRDGDAKHLLVRALFIRHLEHADGAAFDETAREGGLVQQDEGIQRVSISTEGVLDEPVIRRVAGGGEEHAIQAKPPRLMIHLILIACSTRDLDEHVELHANLHAIAAPLRNKYPTPPNGSASPDSLAPSLPYVGRNGKSGPGATRMLVVTSCVTAALLVVTLAGTDAASSASGTVSIPAPAAVLPGLSAQAAMPTAAGLTRALAAQLADPTLGIAPHVEVIDALTGKVLLNQRGTVTTIPASTQKLITAAAALTTLGPRTRFTTRVFAAGANVYLVGGGDPTLSAQPALTGYPASADLNALARAVAARHQPVGQVIAVAPDYGGPDDADGWNPSYLGDGQVARVRSLLVDESKVAPGIGPGSRFSDPVLAAANAFKATLTNAGISSGITSVGALPHGATLVASIKSPPVSALVERMLTFSDADVAEGLGRQVALKLHKPPTFEGVGQSLTQVAKELGLPVGSHFSDASGLSRTDALAPATLTALLRLAVLGTQPQLRTLLTSIPIAGFTGTLAERYTGAAGVGAGKVRAKTGWLNGAAALAGVVTTADHRQLIFAADAPTYARYSGESALDRLAATLATCGCR